MFFKGSKNKKNVSACKIWWIKICWTINYWMMIVKINYEGLKIDGLIVLD